MKRCLAVTVAFGLGCGGGNGSTPSLDARGEDAAGRHDAAPGADAGAHDGGGAHDAMLDARLDAMADARRDAMVDATADAPADAPTPTATILLAASGGTSIVTAEFHTAWTATTVAEASSVAPAVALPTATTGLVTFRGSGDALRYLTWTPGAFSAAQDVAAGDTTRAAPSVAIVDGAAAMAFQGEDFKFYYAVHATSWSPTAEAVGAPQSFGPTPAALAGSGATAIAAYVGQDSDLHDQERSGGSWQTDHAHGLSSLAAITPAVIVPTAGPERMIVFVASGNQLQFTTRTSGVWSAATSITNALTAESPALVALAGGDAALAFRGTDGKAYVARFTAGAWGAPAPIATPDPAISSRPAIARGIGDVELELAYVAAGVVEHTRFKSGAWSAPVAVGGTDVQVVSIASQP